MNPKFLAYSLCPARLRWDFFFLTTVSLLSGCWVTFGSFVLPIPATYLAPEINDLLAPKAVEPITNTSRFSNPGRAIVSLESSGPLLSVTSSTSFINNNYQNSASFRFFFFRVPLTSFKLRVSITGIIADDLLFTDAASSVPAGTD